MRVVAIFALLATLSFGMDRAILNPVKTIDWSFFADKFEAKFKICSCSVEGNELATKAGFVVSFFEPIAAIEVTNNPWKFPSIGLNFGRSFDRKQGNSRDSKRGTFRYGHFIIFPIFSVLNFVQDYICFERAGILNFAYLGEIMPQYNNDLMASFVQPDKLLFGNPVAQLACIQDCAGATFGRPVNSLYWCAGCWYPISTDTGFGDGRQPIVEAGTVAAKLLDFMHTTYGLTKTSNVTFVHNLEDGILRNSMCREAYFPHIIKTQYYLQLEPIGKLRTWADFKMRPEAQDDVVFWLWRKRDECAGAYDCRSTFTGM